MRQWTYGHTCTGSNIRYGDPRALFTCIDEQSLSIMNLDRIERICRHPQKAQNPFILVIHDTNDSTRLCGLNKSNCRQKRSGYVVLAGTSPS